MKSYVSLEQKICIVTGKKFDTNSLLFDKGLKDSLEKSTVTGYGICPEVQEKLDQGYMPLVGVDSSKSKSEGNRILTESDAHRTGTIAYVKKEFLRRLNLLKKEEEDQPFIFADEEGINELVKVYKSQLDA